MVPVPEAISPGDLPCARTTAASLRGRMASGQASPPLGLVSSCSSLPHFPQVVVGYAGNTYILTMALTGVKRNEVPVRIYELRAPRGELDGRIGEVRNLFAGASFATDDRSGRRRSAPSSRPSRLSRRTGLPGY